MRKLAITVLAALTISLGFASTAQASEKHDAVQNEIDSVLERFPGGVQTSDVTIEWDNGAVVLELDAGGGVARSVGTCATGSYCAYNGAGLTGSKLSFSACSTTVSLAALSGSVRSLANARNSGSVQGQNGSGSTLTTLSAGDQVNSAPTGITQLKCVS